MFIDYHLHTILYKGLPRPEGGNFATPEELIAMMDRTGVDKGFLLPLVSPECFFQRGTNEEILEVVSRYPDRFYAFCNIDPRNGSNAPDTDLSYHLKYYQSRGCIGVGEITANLDFGDPLVQNLFRHCELCEMPLIFHIASQRYRCYGLIDAIGLPGLEASLQAFPKLTFIGHSGTFWAEISGNVTLENRTIYPPGPVVPGGTISRLMETYPNLVCGWDAGSGYNALTRDPAFGWAFMERFNERILFGTDICAPTNQHNHAAYLRQSLADGHISEATFENISWRNANRLFKLGL